MKRNITILSIILLGVQIFLTGSSLRYKTTGGHPSSTGAPGEQTCARSTCHDDGTVKDGANVNQFIFGNNENGYEPNKTYDVTVRITQPGITKFGFEVVALKDNGNTNVGTWVVSQTTLMQIINGESPNTSRKYVTHKTNGTVPVSSGVGEWKFQWKAPTTDQGAITFYYSTNATNKNNKETGDQIYLSKFNITRLGMKEEPGKLVSNMNVFMKDSKVVIDFELKEQCNATTKMYSIDGRNVYTENSIKLNSGDQQKNIDISGLNAGIYIISVEAGANISTKKIYINR